MWLENTQTRQPKNLVQMPYLTVNTKSGNPVFRLRADEKTQQELGWLATDWLNVYVDNEKIILKRNNNDRQFPISIYKSQQKPAGYTIYSYLIKDALRKKSWFDGTFKLLILPEGKEMTVVCLKKNSISSR